MTITETRTPWIANLGDVPATLDYFQGSMYEAVEKIAEKYPDYIAYDFMGRSTTYKKFVEQINLCARALKAIGIREGDKITIACPTALRPSSCSTRSIWWAALPIWYTPFPAKRRSNST